jgi:rod shape determining protein RodA
MKSLQVLRQVNWWLVLAMAFVCLCGLVFIGSATQDDPQFAHQHGKQTLFVCCSFGIGFFCLLPHYARFRRLAWPAYALAVLLLLGLPLFAPEINGARRWYPLPGFSIQPSEFAKLAVVLALASLLRFKDTARTFDGIVLPLIVVSVPAVLILRQPDLGSSLVFVPILLAMSYCAGAPARSLLVLCGFALVGAVVASFTMLHGYQRQRIDVWWEHWGWSDADTVRDPSVRARILGAGYQPWQALIAMGSGGALGFGIGRGPQNRYDFLPYRSEDYVFAVVGEEAGFVGCLGLLLVYAALVLGLLHTAFRSRERFGRLLCVGIAAWLGSQVLVHAAVCGWLVPATGLPMPFLSYGGSSLLTVSVGVALCLNVGARREPVLAGDGFR